MCFVTQPPLQPQPRPLHSVLSMQGAFVSFWSPHCWTLSLCLGKATAWAWVGAGTHLSLQDPPSLDTFSLPSLVGELGHEMGAWSTPWPSPGFPPHREQLGKGALPLDRWTQAREPGSAKGAQTPEFDCGAGDLPPGISTRTRSSAWPPGSSDGVPCGSIHHLSIHDSTPLPGLFLRWGFGHGLGLQAPDLHPAWVSLIFWDHRVTFQEAPFLPTAPESVSVVCIWEPWLHPTTQSTKLLLISCPRPLHLLFPLPATLFLLPPSLALTSSPSASPHWLHISQVSPGPAYAKLQGNYLGTRLSCAETLSSRGRVVHFHSLGASGPSTFPTGGKHRCPVAGKTWITSVSGRFSCRFAQRRFYLTLSFTLQGSFHHLSDKWTWMGALWPGSGWYFPNGGSFGQGVRRQKFAPLSPQLGESKSVVFLQLLKHDGYPLLSSEFTSILPRLEPDSGVHPPQAQEADITMGRRKKKKK